MGPLLSVHTSLSGLCGSIHLDHLLRELTRSFSRTGIGRVANTWTVIFWKIVTIWFLLYDVFAIALHIPLIV